MLKPIQLTIVRAVPFNSGVALWATKVEKSGESAITTIPQKNRKAMKTKSKEFMKNKGDKTQQQPDSKRNVLAVFLRPYFCEIYPPKTQASPPMAIIPKESRGMLNCI